MEEFTTRWKPGTFTNDPYRAIRQMIFEEMIMQKLPMKITLRGEELTNE